MSSAESLAASSLLPPETITELVRQSENVYTSHTDVQNDYKKWCKDRKLQNRYPLGKGIMLNALFEIPVKECPSTQALSSGFRQPLPLAGGTADQSAGTLVRRLVLGPRLRVPQSQRPDMWVANLVDVEGKSSAHRVVVKIAQQSSHEFPKDYLVRDGDLSKMEIKHPITLVAPEFFVYERFKHLQGWLLPYSFGIYKIKMNDEDVYVFITEYIEGRHLDAWKADNFHPEDAVFVPPVPTNYFEKDIKMMALLMDGLAELHAGGQGIFGMGFHHCPDHVILIEGSTSEVTGVVFVEFESARMLDNLANASSRMASETMRLLSHVVRCCPPHGRMFTKWMRDEKMVIPKHLFVGVDLSD